MASPLPITSPILFAVREVSGLHLAQGPPIFSRLDQFQPVETKSCRICTFSPNGLYLAYVYGQTLKLVRTDSWSEVVTIEGVKIYYQLFSPKSNYLATFEPYEVTKDKPQGSPNLRVYHVESGEVVKQFVHKPQTNWEPIWSEDEKLFSKIQGTDAIFYEDSNFDNIVNRTKGFKVASYSLATSQGACNIVCHIPGNTSQPSLAKLFKYPNLDGQKAVATKSFFQCDNVAYYWNFSGSYCLLLTSTELDKSGKSYYGKQSLHFIGVNGQTNLVSLPKEGSIHSVAWSPKVNEFCVVYGTMPSKVSIFDAKCEIIRELGVGPRNSIYYNPQGNILLLGGFGNLRGNVQLWDMTSNKIIGNCDCSDTTLLEWCPDGIHFITATTSPRLRIANGYKIWHYSGALLHEKEVEELYQVTWQKFEKGVFGAPKISAEKVEGIASNKVQASTQAYRPPSARNKVISFNLHVTDETGKNVQEQGASKAALKMRKKREARKARKEDDKDGVGGQGESGGNATQSTTPKVALELTGDPEKDKKIKNIEKKLKDITKLKNEQKQGKTLEANQLTKIKGEETLLKELEQLKI